MFSSPSFYLLLYCREILIFIFFAAFIINPFAKPHTLLYT